MAGPSTVISENVPEEVAKLKERIDGVRRFFPEGIDRLKLKLVGARQVGPDGVQVQIYRRDS